MPEDRPLADLFQVAERFRCATNIILDYQDRKALDGYVVTPLSKTILLRVARGLGERANNRSWSITGPYGAGKSSFMLLATRLLRYPLDPSARDWLRHRDPGLYARLLEYVPGLERGGFVIVPMVGSRQPLARTLLEGLVDVLMTWQGSSPLQGHIAHIRELYGRARSGEALSGEIVQAVQETAQVLTSQDHSILGMILVLDELGKSLEYAAQSPESEDVGILQSLAEVASRSERPIIGFLTILHQAFEHYAAGLSPSQQREWSKVQGRFEDIGFLESPGELLSLISQAIRPLSEDNELEAAIEVEASRAAALDLLPADLDKQDSVKVLLGCAPLHPTVALVLGPLFRSRLAQNERSLFAFLSSGEPYGFQEYLRQQRWSDNSQCPFYRLDRLYDYVLSALGSGLYAQARGKRWAEIEDALARLSKESELEARLVKTIGMLGILGDQRSLRASADVLCYALGDYQINKQAIEDALDHLVKSKIVIYQRFKDAYTLWQGSDVDLDERLEQGLAQLDRSASLATLLQEYLKPYVAKRHLHETGTFRFFAPVVVDLEALDKIGDASYADADGIIIFVLLPPGGHAGVAVQQVARFSESLAEPRKSQAFFAVPRHVHGIREAFEEILAWQWVADNTPELEGDSIARRELSARHMAARARLDRAIARCFGPLASYRSCIWVWRGQVRDFDSARSLAAAISEACDSVYHAAPIVKNELVNRRSLSSAAAAARRSLIERMLTKGGEESLGLQGYPPEMSMYLAVLKKSGLHQPMGEKWSFAPPGPEDPGHVLPLWQAIDGFLTTTEQKRRPVTELYEMLRQPPFGIREGLLPIYLTAALVHWQAEVALYEEGSFVLAVGIAELERLMRSPERFSIQRYRLDAARSQMLQSYARIFQTNPEQASVLNSVRSLISFVSKLPRYTHLTQQLSDGAKVVRRTLVTASEPQSLLFASLPGALGFDFSRAGSDLGEYFHRLSAVLLEMQQAYEQLLMRIQDKLLSELRISVEPERARQEIGRRVRAIQDWVSDLRLRGFILRLADARLPNREWLESVAACLVSKPPASWNDDDERDYRLALAQLAGQLRRVEEVALASGAMAQAGRVIGLGITDSSGQEHRDVLHIAPEQEPTIEKAVAVLEEALANLNAEDHLALAALAEVAGRWLGRQQSRKEGHDEP